jgi:hypothetical protein
MHGMHPQMGGFRRIACRRNDIQLRLLRKRRDGTSDLSRRSHDQHSWLVAHALCRLYLAAIVAAVETTDSAASAMISATACGFDMKGAWLECTDRTVAPILFAMNS